MHSSLSVVAPTIAMMLILIVADRVAHEVMTELAKLKECFDRLDGSPRQTAVTISEPFTFGKIVL